MAVFGTVALSSCVREKSFSDVTIGENGIPFVLQNASTRSVEGSSIPAEKGIVIPMGKTDSGESLFLEETIGELNATPATKGAPAYTSYVGELYKSMGVYAAGKFGDSWLIENYNPKTVNLRVRGINKYLDFIGKADLAIKMVKTPKSTFLDNMVSNEDYEYFKAKLRREDDLRWYYIVWTLAATGARISELVQMRVEHVRNGFYDIFSKGGRIRRIYLPPRLARELLAWVDREDGFLFVNRFGNRITPRGIAQQLKELAIKYNINPETIHPHSFRHLFAINFLSRSNDLVLLADLLGHESVDTTRIYLQRSSKDQKRLISQVVNW